MEITELEVRVQFGKPCDECTISQNCTLASENIQIVVLNLPDQLIRYTEALTKDIINEYSKNIITIGSHKKIKLFIGDCEWFVILDQISDQELIQEIKNSKNFKDIKSFKIVLKIFYPGSCNSKDYQLYSISNISDLQTLVELVNSYGITVYHDDYGC